MAASIRDTLLTTLVTRLDAISEFSAFLRDSENVFSAVTAIVVPASEDKTLATTAQYLATYNVEVLIVVRKEDASVPLDASNPYRYLDRMVTLAEIAIHSPDSWGLDPDYTDVMVTGHAIEDPTEENEYVANLFVQFTYRHDYQDPSA